MGSSSGQLVFFAWNAPIGQYRTQRPQSMHFSVSTVGAEKPFCTSAPVGQTAREGHTWF